MDGRIRGIADQSTASLEVCVQQSGFSPTASNGHSGFGYSKMSMAVCQLCSSLWLQNYEKWHYDCIRPA